MLPGDAPDVEQFLRRPKWHARAACRGMGPELFVTERGQPTGPAKALCGGCAVRSECLEAGLAHPELQGVWGGTSTGERRSLRQRSA